MDLIMPGFKKHPPSTGKMKGKKNNKNCNYQWKCKKSNVTKAEI